MRQALLERLTDNGRRTLRLRGRKYSLQAMTATAFLQAQADGRALQAAHPELEKALCNNAALVAGALYRRGRQVFSQGAKAIKSLDPAEIEALAADYAQMAGGWDWNEMLAGLEAAPFERLKWQVCRAFHMLPGEARARAMRDEDYLFCALQLWMDSRERRPRPAAENESFDQARFAVLKEAGR